jgi:hypothetical protein
MIDVSETQPAQPEQLQTRTQPGALATLLPPPPGIAVTPGMTVGPDVPTMDAALADQRYEIEVRDGRTVGVNYDVTVIRGSVLMVMQGPDGVVWQKTLTASETSRAEITVQQGGTYEVLVDIQNFDGQFQLSWD